LYVGVILTQMGKLWHVHSFTSVCYFSLWTDYVMKLLLTEFEAALNNHSPQNVLKYTTVSHFCYWSFTWLFIHFIILHSSDSCSLL